MTDNPITVVVAGVPRSYQAPFEDGRWLTPHHIRKIEAASPDVNLIHMTERDLLAGQLPGQNANVLLVEASGSEPYGDEISAPNIAKLVTPDLNWMQSCSSGVGHILNLGLLDAGPLLTNAAGVHANALAESIIAALLFHAKKLRQRIDNQRDKVWQELHCTELTGKNLLVIGTGNIGTEAARRAKAFGLKTTGIRRSSSPAAHFDVTATYHELHYHLKSADFIVIACPLTQETEGMIGAAEFDLMKPDSYLINIARGKIIDERALIAAVNHGQIGGAYLDALTEEPLPEDRPLWDTPGITIVPHDSHSSPLIGDNIIDLFSENLRRFASGLPLMNMVDPSKGY